MLEHLGYNHPMVHVQGFKIDDEGNVQKSEKYHTDVKVCAKCGKVHDGENVAKTEMNKVTVGPAAGRDKQDIWCENCGQRNIFVLPLTQTS